jgi:uncharacterized protein (TIGR02118 family)
MIKLTFCLRRLPSFTLEAFQDYWLNTHAPLVADRAEVLNIVRYQQVHTADLAGLHEAMRARNGGAPEPFDGVAELWWDSLDAMRTESESARQASAELLEDERRFIDLRNSPMWIAEEHHIVG